MFEEGFHKDETYFVENGKVRQVNKAYANANDSIELMLGNSTRIERATISIDLNKLIYQFIPFSELHMHLGNKSAIGKEKFTTKQNYDLQFFRIFTNSAC